MAAVGKAFVEHRMSLNPDDLRDYFAAAALQSVSCGIIAETDHGTTAESLAATAYRIADAMLASREQKGSE